MYDLMIAMLGLVLAVADNNPPAVASAFQDSKLEHHLVQMNSDDDELFLGSPIEKSVKTTNPNLNGPFIQPGSTNSNPLGELMGGRMVGSGNVPMVGGAPMQSPMIVDAGTGPSIGDFEASRVFASEKEYPPNRFGAYAVVAFKAAPGELDWSRYKLICEAYRRSVPHFSLVELETEQQLVTVWPIASVFSSDSVMLLEEKERCNFAVNNYGHTMALRAIRNARAAASNDIRDTVSEGRGPFLFAWSPAETKGNSDTLVLRMDLSDVDTEAQAMNRFGFWVQAIESDPSTWADGWQQVSLRQRLAENADKYGSVILDFFGG